MPIDADRRTILRLREVIDPDAYHQVVLSFCESERRNGQRTIDGLQEILRSMQGMEGRKHVLFVSEGIPLLAGYEMLVGSNRSVSLDVLHYDQSRAFRDL